VPGRGLGRGALHHVLDRGDVPVIREHVVRSGEPGVAIGLSGEHLRAALQKHNKAGGGSSTRIARIHLMLEPPSIDGHEITDKGYVNQAATASRRAHLVERLYQDPVPEDVIVV